MNRDPGELSEARVPQSGIAVLIKNAWAQQSTGDTAGALALLRDALRQSPESVPLHLEIAKMYEATGNPNKTIEYCAKALKRDCSNPTAYTLMGNAYFIRRQSYKAVPLLRKALDVDPSYTLAYVSLGNAVWDDVMAVGAGAISFGDDEAVDIAVLEEAIAYRRRGCETKWQWLRAYYRMGMLYYYAGDLDMLHQRLTSAAEDGYQPAQEWLEEIKAAATQQSSAEMLHFDLRDDKERKIERDAIAGISLGEEYDLLVKELIEIGRSDDYLSTEPGGKFDDRCRHLRTREIGNHLNDRGGKDLMCAVYYRVGHAMGSGAARRLEIAWGYIGECLP